MCASVALGVVIEVEQGDLTHVFGNIYQEEKLGLNDRPIIG